MGRLCSNGKNAARAAARDYKTMSIPVDMDDQRPSRLMKLSVVIPVFNEAATIAGLIGRVRAVPLDKEIIVVDDCSNDGTREVLKNLPSAPDLLLRFHDVNRGKGAALRTGFAAATGDVVVVQDADL